MPCMYGIEGWPCANCGGLGGHWYEGEPVPGTCILNALPVNYGMSVPWGWDSRHVPKEMLGLMEGGGLPTVEELLGENKENEEQGEQRPAVGKAGPS